MPLVNTCHLFHPVHSMIFEGRCCMIGEVGKWSSDPVQAISILTKMSNTDSRISYLIYHLRSFIIEDQSATQVFILHYSSVSSCCRDVLRHLFNNSQIE